MLKKYIGYAGLSHLSLCYAISSAIKGYDIVLFDFDKKIINQLNSYLIDFNEKNILKYFKKYRKNFHLTSQMDDLKKCKTIFISKDIKTNNNNESDYRPIKKYISELDKKIPKKISFIIQSQVTPGFCNSLNIKKRDLFYHVETLIFGKALERATHPERIIVGYDIKKKKKFDHFYNEYLKKYNCPILKMNYLSAEISKMAINLSLSSSVTIANLLSRLSDKIGANYLDIEKSLRSDSRIGKYSYLAAGLGISGGNIERDLNNFKKIFSKNKISPNFVKSIIKNSSDSKNWIIDCFLEIYKKNKFKRIAILGLSYKKDNSTIKNSPSINFLKRIKNLKINVGIYDDLIDNFDNNSISDLKNAIKDAELIIIARDFKNIDFIIKNIFLDNKKIKYCLDPFSLIDKNSFKNKSNINIIQIGKNRLTNEI